jgi:hypothetical protein
MTTTFLWVDGFFYLEFKAFNRSRGVLLSGLKAFSKIPSYLKFYCKDEFDVGDRIDVLLEFWRLHYTVDKLFIDALGR